MARWDERWRDGMRDGAMGDGCCPTGYPLLPLPGILCYPCLGVPCPVALRLGALCSPACCPICQVALKHAIWAKAALSGEAEGP